MPRIRNEEELIEKTAEKYSKISRSLNELSRRLWAGSENISIGYGGISLVSRATGLSGVTVRKGMNEIKNNDYPGKSIRREGGGRKSVLERMPATTHMLRGDA